MKTDAAPYVGPRPFGRSDGGLFFGRDREASDLVSLVFAHTTVLVYAQSGAGKTSLLNARLIPLLQEEGFDVLPLARVRALQHLPLSIPATSNFYMFNVLLNWTEGQVDAPRLAPPSLTGFLAERERPLNDEGFPIPRVVIFDQFEELFTSHPEYWKHRQAFFEGVCEALEERVLTRVVFAMREDYMADLDPYARMLPEKLRTRFRLERLREHSALEAIRGPLRATGRSFAKGVAERLVEELRQIRIETSNGLTTQAPGEFIEPLLLQIVCQRLWQNLPARIKTISHQHLRDHGDPSRALSRFYDSAVEQATLAADVGEGRLRQWCETVLITPANTRSTIFRDRTETGGLPNAAVDALERLYLIRGEWRAGARWYELSHDRLIDVVRESNQRQTSTNLPRQLSTFIDREREVTQVGELLGLYRMLTLTGVPGCGKTRLAIEVAQLVLPKYPDGVWFVGLASLSDRRLVPDQVALSLGIQAERERPPLQTLVTFLRSRQLLLLLDNCEHVLEGCASLAGELLDQAPQVTILATSRAPLRVSAEQVYHVPTLSVPDLNVLSSTAVDAETLPSNSPAVQLFVDRARHASPLFELTPQNAASIAKICSRLDGIPLAIELAAARTRVMSPEQIFERLHDISTALLSGGSRVGPQRQRALRATFDWSYELLTSVQQNLFRQLSVFAGDFSLDAVEKVCQDATGAPHEILEALAALVESSLVEVTQDTHQSRYRLLHLLRQYASERLSAQGEVAMLRERHRAWYLAVAEEAAPALRGPDAGKVLDALERDHDNLRAALSWSIDSDNVGEGLRLAVALHRFWALRGYLTEGRACLDALLSRSMVDPSARIWADAISAAGWLAVSQSDLAQAEGLFRDSLNRYRTLDGRLGEASALHGLATVYLDRDGWRQAGELLQHSLVLSQRLDDHQGRVAVLRSLGRLAVYQGDLDAEDYFARSLYLASELGDLIMSIWLRVDLAWLDLVRGNLRDSYQLYHEALQLFRELNVRTGLIACLEGLAAVSAGEKEWEGTMQFLAEAQSLREALRIPRLPAEERAHSHLITSLQQSLGEEGFAAAMERARTMSRQQPIAGSPGELTDPSTDPASSPPST